MRGVCRAHKAWQVHPEFRATKQDIEHHSMYMCEYPMVSRCGKISKSFTMTDTFAKKFLWNLGIALTIIAVLAIAIFFFAGNISKYSANIIDLRNQLRNRSHSLENLAALRLVYNEKAKGYLSQLYASVPVKDQLITVPRDFQILATRAGVTMTYTNVGDTQPIEGQLGEFRFQMQIQGTADKAIPFIDTVQKFRYLTTVDSVHFSRQGDQVQLSLNGRIFYRAQ